MELVPALEPGGSKTKRQTSHPKDDNTDINHNEDEQSMSRPIKVITMALKASMSHWSHSSTEYHMFHGVGMHRTTYCLLSPALWAWKASFMSGWLVLSSASNAPSAFSCRSKSGTCSSCKSASVNLPPRNREAKLLSTCNHQWGLVGIHMRAVSLWVEGLLHQTLITRFALDGSGWTEMKQPECQAWASKTP